MNYPIICRHCNHNLFGPVKYCPFCGIELSPVIEIINAAKTYINPIVTENNKKEKVIDVVESTFSSDIDNDKFINDTNSSDAIEAEQVEIIQEELKINWNGIEGNENNKIGNDKVNLKNILLVAISVILILTGVVYLFIPKKKNQTDVAIQGNSAPVVVKSLPSIATNNHSQQKNNTVTTNKLKVTLSDHPQKKGATDAGNKKDIIVNFTPMIFDAHKRPIASIKSGEAVSLGMRYELLIPKDSRNQQRNVVEYNTLIASNGHRIDYPGLRRESIRSRGGTEAVISITIPKGLVAGQYTHYASLTVDGRTYEKSQLIFIKDDAKSQVNQQEVSSYLQDGIRYYESGKYELSIEKMKEVLKRDRSNNRASQYINMARNKLDEIDQVFQNAPVGPPR
ncbi:MAG: hypothetical protein WCI81_01090 [Chlorobiaceae bacterium]